MSRMSILSSESVECTLGELYKTTRDVEHARTPSRLRRPATGGFAQSVPSPEASRVTFKVVHSVYMLSEGADTPAAAETPEIKVRAPRVRHMPTPRPSHLPGCSPDRRRRPTACRMRLQSRRRRTFPRR